MSDTGNASATLICKLLSYETSSGLVYHDIQPSSSILCNPWAAYEPGLHIVGDCSPQDPCLSCWRSRRRSYFVNFSAVRHGGWFAEALRTYIISRADHSKVLHDPSAMRAWGAVATKSQHNPSHNFHVTPPQSFSHQVSAFKQTARREARRQQAKESCKKACRNDFSEQDMNNVQEIWPKDSA